MGGTTGVNEILTDFTCNMFTKVRVDPRTRKCSPDYARSSLRMSSTHCEQVFDCQMLDLPRCLPSMLRRQEVNHAGIESQLALADRDTDGRTDKRFRRGMQHMWYISIPRCAVPFCDAVAMTYGKICHAGVAAVKLAEKLIDLQIGGIPYFLDGGLVTAVAQACRQ
jgi:hypothetical protein